MLNSRIWLIGGTQDSQILAQALVNAQIPALVTVTTVGGRSLYPVSPLLHIEVGAIDPAKMAVWIQTQHIALILDASHPFATQVSQGAIAAAQACQVPYLRFDRPSLTSENQKTSSFIQVLGHQEAGIEHLPLAGERVLLILGYRRLPEFQSWHDRATLFTRILPSAIALETALNSGFDPRRIIALRPPVSLELEAALWKQWQISLVIAKESGQPGGEAVKRQVAEQLGVKLLLLPRPGLHYPAVTREVEAAIAVCRQALGLI